MEVLDKGKAAAVTSIVETKDKATGKAIFENQSTVFIRGAGGFGGKRVGKGAFVQPTRLGQLDSGCIALVRAKALGVRQYYFCARDALGALSNCIRNLTDNRSRRSIRSEYTASAQAGRCC